MDKKIVLSTLWIFLTVNFVFCDVFTLMHSEDLRKILTGNVDGIQMSQQFLLGFAFIMEIPMLMILVSRVLRHPSNRILNVVFSVLLAIVQIWSLTAGGNTMHYWFFSIIEIATLISILLLASFWKNE